MNAPLRVALWAETLKLRRSRLPLLTALAMALAPVLGALLVVAVRDPSSTGALGAKAVALGSADWAGFLGFLVIFDAGGGLLVFGTLTAWMFGREFSDHTAVDLLAVPTPRLATVAAKFLVIAAWAAALTAVVLLVGLPIGVALGLPGWDPALLARTVGQLAVASTLTVVLVTPFALAASAWRGYLPAMGLMLVVMVIGQVLGQIGVGPWFPWSVPALATGIAAAAVGSIGPQSVALVLLTSIGGAALTGAWWTFADQQ
jgi:ABC-2 type transport system permease protein